MFSTWITETFDVFEEGDFGLPFHPEPEMRSRCRLKCWPKRLICLSSSHPAAVDPCGSTRPLLDAEPSSRTCLRHGRHGGGRFCSVELPLQCRNRFGERPQCCTTITAERDYQFRLADAHPQRGGDSHAGVEASGILLQMSRLSCHHRSHSGARSGTKPLSAKMNFTSIASGVLVRGWTTTQAGLVTAASFRT